MAERLNNSNLAPTVISVSAIAFLLLFTLSRSTPAYSEEVSNTELITAPLSFYTQYNLLALENRAQVVRVPSNSAAAEYLIDGSPHSGWRSIKQFASSQPVEILFRLPTQKELASLLIQPQSSWPGVSMPQEMEILVGENEDQSSLVSVGRFRLQRKAAWQRLQFPSHKAIFLKLRIHSIHGTGQVGLGEVAAFAPGIDARAPRYYFKPTTVTPVVIQPIEAISTTSHKKSTLPVKTDKPTLAISKKTPPKASLSKPLSLEQRIADALKHEGYGALFFSLRDNKQALLTGLVSSEKDKQRAEKIIRGFAEVREVEVHLLSGPAKDIHPRDIRLQANAAMRSARLNKVDVRMRKRGELILVGKVNSNEEEQLALAIARSQPGVSKIVNQLQR